MYMYIEKEMGVFPLLLCIDDHYACFGLRYELFSAFVLLWPGDARLYESLMMIFLPEGRTEAHYLAERRR